MCTAPKISQSSIKSAPVLATPTYADASISKPSLLQRNSEGNRNIKTSSRGLLEDAYKVKKGLLGE